ncbi:MAG: amidase [Gammaproteobacteria bacterium]
MDTAYLELTAVSRLLEAGELTSEQLTRDLFARIDRLDPRLHVFARRDAERALARARELDAERAAGKVRGPLHGIPLALKDIFWEEGQVTAFGTAVLKDFRAAEDATAVARLKAAGANLIGAVQLTEGAYAVHLPPIQAPVNPWHADYWSGASSSGSGVVVASGLAYGSLGTETGGSIHLPSAVNGVTGLKPTWGRVSRHGVFELGATLDHVGPLARSAADAACLLQAIAGPDPRDPTSARVPVPDYTAALRRDLRGLRVGVDASFAFGGVDAVTVKAVQDAIATLRELGATIVDIEFPDVTQMVADWFPVCAVQTAVAHEATYPARKAEYGEALASLIEMGRALSGMEHQKLILRRLDFRGRVEAAFEQMDLMVLPVLTLAETTLERMSRFDDELIMAAHRFTCCFTMSGNPCITLPCGYAASGTPVSFQFVGAHWSEPLLLGAAHAFQGTTAWHRRHPTLT